VKLAPDVNEISKPDGGVTLISPVKLLAFIVYSSSAELVLSHSPKAPSPDVQLLPERVGRLSTTATTAEF
jgi:hypothetical protein